MIFTFDKQKKIQRSLVWGREGGERGKGRRRKEIAHCSYLQSEDAKYKVVLCIKLIISVSTRKFAVLPKITLKLFALPKVFKT